MSAPQLYVGIDVGTTEVRTVVGTKIEDQDTPSIIGSGSSLNRGMRRGVVVNIDEVAAAIVRSVEQAERISGQRVQRATVGINGSHIISLSSRGVVAIGGPEHEIDIDDLARAEEAAMVVQLPANRDILQIFPRNYHLDGQENIKDPLGMSGIRLEIDALMVTAAVPAIKALERACERADVQVSNKIVCGLAASEAVLQPIQRESGAVVADIGATTTNITVYEEDDIQHIAVLPVGSVHITNDLAIGLKTDLAIADKVKLHHARLDSGSNNRSSNSLIRLEHEEQHYSFEAREVNAIITARLEEIFDVINKELKKINKDGRLPGGVVLTGGGALLPGIDELAKKCLSLPAHIGIPHNFSGVIDTVSSPTYATAVGLMMLSMRLAASEASFAKPRSIGGFFKRLIKNFIP